MKIDLPNLTATSVFGAAFGSLLGANDVVSLQGSLGAGKTALVRAIAPALGCRGAIASPTYLYLMEHPALPGGLALHHFDVYRLLDGAAFCDLGFTEILDDGGVSLIEWGDRVADVLPERTIVCQIAGRDDDDPEAGSAHDLSADFARQICLYWPPSDKRAGRLAALLRAQGLTVTEAEASSC